VLATIIRRQGQTQFREGLLKNYRERCAATGYTAREVLEAAHIDPYRGAKSNVLSNGLLLRADIHTLFDLNLIGVDDQGRWVVSSRLAGTAYADLAGKRLAPPSSSAPDAAALARHLIRLER
jgi:predicted restriction endonuclease